MGADGGRYLVTGSELQARTLTRLDEDAAAPGYYSAAEALAALNEAQRVFVLLTLCLETAVTMPLDAATAFYRMLTVYPDWLLPLRIRMYGGAKLAPCRLADLDALNLYWQDEPGTPERYAHLGFDFLALGPRPSSEGMSIDLAYARSPAVMTHGGMTPEIPAEYHPDLIDYAIPRMRAKEGGSAFTGSLKYFERFLIGADKLGSYVRARNKAAGYDRGPFELRAADRSKLMGVLTAETQRRRGKQHG